MKKYLILGAAFDWGYRKGLDVFLELRSKLSSAYRIVLVGIDDNTEKAIPNDIICIPRTNNQYELAQIYTAADVFVNPTREEVLGMVNVESLACGTPVITFNTGGCPEVVSGSCGFVTNENTTDNIKHILDSGSWMKIDRQDCIERAREFCMNDKYKEYVKLYEKISHSKSGV